MTGTVAITMAGRGSRFVKMGYARPKYEVMAHGRPLFDWSILSLTQFRDAGYRFSFLARSNLQAEDFIAERALALKLGSHDVLTTDTVTDGQATSALILANTAPQETPFAIYNIDTFANPEVLAPPAEDAMEGWIPCFPAPGDGWSFARTDASGNVIELREKKRISSHATIGLYWFSKARRYVELYDTYFSKPGNEEMGERYVAPLYNQMIADGDLVQIADLAMSDVGMLGTPEQVEAFIANPPVAALKVADL